MIALARRNGGVWSVGMGVGVGCVTRRSSVGDEEECADVRGDGQGVNRRQWPMNDGMKGHSYEPNKQTNKQRHGT